MGLELVNCTIEGVSPLLLNRFTDEAAMQASGEGGKGSFARGDKGTPREQAEKKLYLAADGATLVIPQPNMFRCMIDAGTFFKAGKSKVTTQKSSLIPACVAIPSVEIPIEHIDPWEVDTRAVRIPSTGGRILCHRPSFHDWRLSFEIELDTEIFDLKMLRAIVDAAGKRIGLGDFRPACKGPFGRFVVVAWAVESQQEKVEAKEKQNGRAKKPEPAGV